MGFLEPYKHVRRQYTANKVSLAAASSASVSVIRTRQAGVILADQMRDIVATQTNLSAFQLGANSRGSRISSNIHIRKRACDEHVALPADGENGLGSHGQGQECSQVVVYNRQCTSILYLVSVMVAEREILRMSIVRV